MDLRGDCATWGKSERKAELDFPLKMHKKREKFHTKHFVTSIRGKIAKKKMDELVFYRKTYTNLGDLF